jgi:DNA-directed RNA polymerase specialized sigma24 family protein
VGKARRLLPPAHRRVMSRYTNPAGPAEMLKTDDQGSVDRAVETFRPRVLAMTRVRMRDAEEAESVTSEILRRAAREVMGRALDPRDPISAVVHEVALRVVSERLADRDEAPLWAGFDEKAFDDPERLGIAEERIAAAGALERKVLLLVLVEGLQPAEIATQLAISPAVAAACRTRGLRRLLHHSRRERAYYV